MSVLVIYIIKYISLCLTFVSNDCIIKKYSYGSH